jgi:hypothetical protein
MLRIFLFGLSNRRKQPERYTKCPLDIFPEYGKVKIMEAIILIGIQASGKSTFYKRVVQKLQFLNNFRLKTAKCRAFCETCERTHKVLEQVHSRSSTLR